MNVLAVDDIGYSRHNLAMGLERLGHEVVQAGSGTAGLSILRKDHTIDVVITDLIMDDIDGVELFIRANRLERVNDQGLVPLPPFILLTCAQPGRPGTTNAVMGRLTLAKELGFAEILFKPINPKDIAAALDRLQVASTSPTVDVVPLVAHLKEITQKLIRNENVEAAEELKRSLQTHLQLLDQVTAAVEV